MKRFLKYKRNFSKFAGLLGLCSFFLVATPVVMAQSGNYLTNPAPGSACTIGTTGGAGIIQKDGRTCCPTQDGQGTDTNNGGIPCFFDKYVNPFVQLLSAGVGIIVVIAIIIGAVEYTTSGGDPQRTASGRQHITNALLALVAYAILYVFLQFLIPGGLLHG